MAILRLQTAIQGTIFRSSQRSRVNMRMGRTPYTDGVLPILVRNGALYQSDASPVVRDWNSFRTDMLADLGLVSPLIL
jgi:hypothetical protein